MYLNSLWPTITHDSYRKYKRRFDFWLLSEKSKAIIEMFGCSPEQLEKKEAENDTSN